LSSQTSPLLAQSKDFLKRHREVILLLIFFFTCWGFLYTTAGGPTTWDELLYMDLGLNPRPDGTVLNRWAHIYFQKLFLEIAPTPLQGAKLFWGFLVSSTLVFVYLSAKTTRPKSNYLNGIAAVLFFSGSSLIFMNAGITYADYTVMFFVVLSVLIYLSYFRSGSRYRWLLPVLFGFFLFAAVKSKETGLVLSVLIAGFGFKDKVFDLRHFVKNCFYIFVGVLIGFGLLVLLDNLFISNPWASISSQSLSEYSAFEFNNSSLEIGIKVRIYTILVNFFTYFWHFARPLTDRILWRLPVLCTLYLITLFTLTANLLRGKQKKRPWTQFYVWLLPIGFLGLLILAASGAKDRHFFPIYPILAILGAQFFTITLPFNTRSVFSRVRGFLSLPRVLVSILLLGIFFFYRYGSEVAEIYNAVLVTISGMTLILLAIWVKKWSTMTSAVALFSVIVFSFYGLFFESLVPLAKGEIAAQSIERFEPLEDIKEYFECKSTTRIYVSANVHRNLNTLGRDLSSQPWFFNVFFDCGLTISQFTFAWPPALPRDLTAAANYSYAFLTTVEFNELSREGKQEIEAMYIIKYIYEEQILFLRSK